MKQILCIFASLLFLASCGEETIPNRQCYFSVTLSDALPVQFWQRGCSTYNETTPKGVHQKCFCAPWQCDDQIRIQFKEDYSPDVDYLLIAQNSNGDILADLVFTEIEAGIHSVAFSPETEGVCDEVISLLIVDETALSKIVAPDTGWTDNIGTWTKTANSVQVDEAAGGGQSQVDQDIDIPLNGTMLSFTVLVTISGTWTGTVTVQIEPRNSGGFSCTSTPTSQNYGANTTDSSLVVADEICSLMAADRLRVSVSLVGTGTATVKVELPVGDIIYIDTDSALAKSDCLDVRLSFDDDFPTELIEYSNARNFAGLIYSDISPDASFNIRVPCRFFHEVNPEQDEAIELTSSVITTSGELKSQKLLEIQPAPYYFHKKLQLILKHQNLTINGVDYQKEEKYEVIEGSKRWPLKQATCLLTEKNSVIRNVI